MANELTLTVSMAFAKVPVASQGLSANSQQFTVSGINYNKKTQLIPTTAGGTAIDVAGLATLGWIMVKNLDATNYVTLLAAVSGATICRIPPSASILLYLDPAVTAPAAIAHTGACMIEYMMVEN